MCEIGILFICGVALIHGLTRWHKRLETKGL